MAEVGSLSARAKMAIKTFVKYVFTIFATNASFFIFLGLRGGGQIRKSGRKQFKYPIKYKKIKGSSVTSHQ